MKPVSRNSPVSPIRQEMHRRQCRDLLQRFGRLGGWSRRLGRRLGETVQEDVVDHLVEINRDLLVAHGLREFADQPPRALCDLDQVCAGLRDLLREGSREHRIGIVVIVGETIERGLSRARREDREHALRQLRHRRQAAAAGHRAGAGALERIVAAGIEHQDRGAYALVLQPLDDAIGQDRGIAHQFFLAFAGRRHVGRQQKILARDLKAMTGVKEERGVALLDRLVERQQGLAERLSRLVFRQHHGKAELL